MSALDRILRQEPLPADRAPTTAELLSRLYNAEAAARSLDEAYRATIGRMQATINTQTAYIAKQQREIDSLRMICGLETAARHV